MKNSYLFHKNTLRNLLLYSLLCCNFMFSSCKKYEDNTNKTTYTITGNMYKDCSLEPVIGLKLFLLGGENSIFGHGTSGVMATSTTDSNGYFKFVFSDFGGTSQAIQYAAGYGYNTVMEHIPVWTSLDNIVLFLHPSTNIQVSLNVINPHTISDTLLITNFQGTHQLKLPGPFSSGILYTAISYSLFDIYYDGEVKQLNWLFTPNLGQIFRKDFTVNKFCQDTIFVTADIN